MRTPIYSILLLSGFTLAACSLTPTYQRPVAPLPAQWSSATDTPPAEANAATVSVSNWQGFVRDDALRQLINQALASNRELRSSLLQVEAARAIYGIQRADRLPGLELDASGQHQRLPADLNASTGSSVQSSYQVGLGLTAFELDLFGRVRNLTAAAEEEYLASAENAQTARISLVSEVMRGWVLRNSAWQQRQLAEQTQQTRQRSLSLIQHRQRVGLASTIDLQEARGLAEQADVEVERARRELAQTEHALQLLLGDGTALPAVVPSATSFGSAPFATLSPELPADLLTQRPDIRAAEHQLRARNASIGAARAAFFPSISLTGLFGTASSELSSLFDSGQRSWNFMPQLRLPIFAGGRNQANLELATVRQDIAIADYEKAIQTAFREVNDTLVAGATLQREEAALRARLDAGQQRLRLAEARYRAGVDDHLRYLDAQRDDYANQVELNHVQAQRQLAQISLFRALGGGLPGAAVE
ncbi:MAG: efflux transporter outer membrane subunit [Sterolibacterium sp.]|nr:efflux transporter outer membrane subunit [Sterolibacterium sp.]